MGFQSQPSRSRVLTNKLMASWWFNTSQESVSNGVRHGKCMSWFPTQRPEFVANTALKNSFKIFPTDWSGCFTRQLSLTNRHHRIYSSLTSRYNSQFIFSRHSYHPTSCPVAWSYCSCCAWAPWALWAPWPYPRHQESHDIP